MKNLFNKIVSTFISSSTFVTYILAGPSVQIVLSSRYRFRGALRKVGGLKSGGGG